MSALNYKNKLHELNSRMNITISEKTHIYPQFKLYPNNEKINKLYKTDLKNIKNLSKDFFMLHNDLQNEINLLGKSIKTADKELIVLDKENEKLLRELNNLKNSDFAAKGMYDDIQYQYNQALFTNIMFFSVLLGSVGIFLKFGRQVKK